MQVATVCFKRLFKVLLAFLWSIQFSLAMENSIWEPDFSDLFHDTPSILPQPILPQSVEEKLIPELEYRFAFLIHAQMQSAKPDSVWLSIDSLESDTDLAGTTWFRTTKLSILEWNETKRNESRSVGYMILFENPLQLYFKGPFHLEFICIFEEFSRRGRGGKALDALRSVAQYLCSYNPMYQFISLKSGDVEYQGVQMYGVPSRVKFYLNNGFQFHPKAIELIQFLSTKHFVRKLDKKQFWKYLMDYEFMDEAMCQDHPTEELKKSANIVLGILKESEMLEDEPFNKLLTKVKTHSSFFAPYILDRAYYDSTVTDEEQSHFDKYLYYMIMDVTAPLPPFQSTLAHFNCADTEFKEKMWKGKHPLLLDQISLNRTIRNLLKWQISKKTKKQTQKLRKRRQNPKN